MSETPMLHFTVNGETVDLPVKPGETLAELLRERLGLTGTKIGCNESECGSCTVLVDNEPILSCSFPAPRVNGKNLITVEGLNKQIESQSGLHPLQEAFIKHGAVQCGFCIPGQLMTAYGLLLRNDNPTREDIRHALKDTLCRCAGYPTIENSILAAAEALRTKQPVAEPKIPDSKRAMRIIGKMNQRPESIAKVTGEALYTDDLKFENMLYGKAKHAEIPHAIIKKIDVEKAKALPGVVAVMTAKDIPGSHYHGVIIKDWPVMVDVGEKVRYVGDTIAIVAAETNEIAAQAIDLIEFDYEELPIVTDPVQAIQPDTIHVHEKGNLLKHIKVRKGDVDAGFEQADIVLEHTFHTGTTDHAFMEPECSVARLTPEGRMEVFVGSQIPYEDREQVAAALGWDEERVHIKGMLIGGGFGGKEDITGQIHAALLAWKTKQPVKILFDRRESLIVHVKRHATQIKVKLGAKKDGTLVSALTELYGDTGAYASLGEAVMTRATTHSSGPYEIPNVKGDCFAMLTNNIPAGAYRGFGVTQSAFAVESMMDMLAEKLNIDPIDIRKKNALHEGSITNTGQVLHESVGLPECLEKVETEIKRIAGNNAFKSRPVEGKPHIKRAWGIAAAYKNTGLGGGTPDIANAEVELYENGEVEVRSSSAEIGQGLVTVLQMIVAEELSMPAEKVRVLLSDTDLTPDGGPTTASRQTFMTGNAAKGAAVALKNNLINSAAEIFDRPPQEINLRDGMIVYDHQAMSLDAFAKELKKMGLETKALYRYNAPETKPLGEGGDMHFAFSFAVQAAEVEVDTRTGEVKVLKVIAANDVGTALNPLGLQGQVEGGVMMGIGNAITERFLIDKGKVITDRMATYRMPSIEHMPEITSIIVEAPVSTGPFGAKGVGEISSIPTTPAITNAIYNAVGVRVDRLPVDQELIAMQLVSKK